MTGLRAQITAAFRGERPTLTGPFLTVASPMVVEIACGSGPDFVCIDLEHAPIAAETAENMLRAAALHSVPALVRVPGVDALAIGQALDWGAAGVLVPRVNSPEEAALCVSAARFPPEGARGAGPSRASGYGRAIPAMLRAAHDETVVAIQIETVSALERLDAILAVPGVDLVFIGPGDLSVGLDAIGDPRSLTDVIDMILDRCRSTGRPAGIFAMTQAGLSPCRGRIALGIVGSDTTILVEGFDRTFAGV